MMFKTLFFILFTFAFTGLAEAVITARWLTVTSMLINDGKTKILFDPAWTRPTWKHWLNLEEFRSDEKTVKGVLESNGAYRIDAIFTSHSHFDHVIDAPMVSKLTGAIFYVDKSSERLARAYQDKKIRTIFLQEGHEIRIGDFLIIPLHREHPKFWQLFQFLPGEVPANTKLGFYDYKLGENWLYLVKHPLGTILVDQGSTPYVEMVKKYTPKLDVVIQGVANRISDESVVEGYPKAFKPQIFIPTHFDNFLLGFQEAMGTYLPGVKLENVLTKMKKAHPSMKVDRPKYGQEIEILKAK